jgi:hypothetical protein
LITFVAAAKKVTPAGRQKEKNAINPHQQVKKEPETKTRYTVRRTETQIHQNCADLLTRLRAHEPSPETRRFIKNAAKEVVSQRTMHKRKARTKRRTRSARDRRPTTPSSRPEIAKRRK